MKVEDLSMWQAFRGVATHGNFTQAARALRIPVSLLSKRVARLEDSLDVRLFQRSTRVVSLTDEGRGLLPRVNALLEDLDGIESQFDVGKQGISGTLRITSVPFLSRPFLIPVMSDLAKAHPALKFEVDLSERIQNLVETGFDLALRIDEPEGGDLIYRKLGSNDLVFCASPSYLATHKKRPLKKLEDLKGHSLLSMDKHRDCRFRNQPKIKLGDLKGDHSQIFCDEGSFLTDLALAGQGVLVRSIWDVREHLEAGRLVPVLEKFPLQPFGQIYAVIPSRRLLAPRVRVFLDALVHHGVQAVPDLLTTGRGTSKR